MALSDVALCARALVMIGVNPIASFAEETVEAEVAGMLYPALRDGMLAAYPWRFAARGMWLPRRGRDDDAAETPPDGLQEFALPGDFIRLLALETEGSALPEFELRKGVVACAGRRAYLRYVGRMAEASFPVWFDMALIARLAAEFCLPLTESTSRAEYLHKRADDLFHQARLADAQQSTPRRIEDFPLLEARG
ncbi:hypothetical protein TH25_20120 [Thalassospira profundimaris]|uniref:Uncharacterized protein n=1 Tax=Thalassospira profundimaris TaxID=502049 RepID=A0A367WUT7_9PROT|nr:hypothetical protein [Thalassospira profundimaris]RCK44212.1 hypothetical protein TH25_20120 [Thalassospira profundimaris]